MLNVAKMGAVWVAKRGVGLDYGIFPHHFAFDQGQKLV
jgi:hypothetical protein